MARLGERLAGEAGAKDVVIKNLLIDCLVRKIRLLVVDILSCERANILVEPAAALGLREVSLVDDLALGIDLAGEFTFIAKISEGPVKPTYACKQIYELEAHNRKLATPIGERKLSILNIYP